MATAGRTWPGKQPKQLLRWRYRPQEESLSHKRSPRSSPTSSWTPQPFSKLVQARVTAFEPGRAVLEVDVRDELLQQNGFLHGGVLSYAADNALTFAGGSALGASVLTSGFSIEYLRPGKGVLLSARAHVLESTRRRAVCRCDLVMIDPEGTERMVAAAQGTITLIDR